MADKFDVKLVEVAKYYTPDPSYREKAWEKDYEKTYQEFLADPDAFWDRIAREIDWFAPWDRVLDRNYPYAMWFTNAKLNITANCLDRHVYNHRRNKVAIIWRGGGANESNKFKNVFEFKKYTEG